MDSTRLGDLLEQIDDRRLPIHGLVIVRNGAIVAEAYSPPFDEQLAHDIASCEKTVVSVLTGIAIDRGLLAGVDLHVADVLPETSASVSDPHKRVITLGNLLTMTAGLASNEWQPMDADNTWVQMQRSADRLKSVFDRPLIEPPGTAWSYDSGLPDVVGLMIERTSSLSLKEFALSFLFRPLQIDDLCWRGSPATGISITLTPREMAKLGSLFLDRGTWDGKRVISSAWVASSTAAHVDTRVEGNRYGNFWWIPPYGGYAAWGDGGQRIIVNPERNLVVVLTAGLGYPEMDTVPDEIMTRYVLPAAESRGRLPDNPVGLARLQALTRRLAQPHPEAVPPLPATAATVSGRAYTLPDNSIGLEGFAFHFAGQRASISLRFAGRLQEIPVGLDNLYRPTRVEPAGLTYGWMAARGRWVSRTDFTLDLLMSGLARRFDFAFDGVRVIVTYHGSRGEDEPIFGSSE